MLHFLYCPFRESNFFLFSLFLSLQVAAFSRQHLRTVKRDAARNLLEMNSPAINSPPKIPKKIPGIKASQ